MTRKQLEQAIRLISMYDGSGVDIATINETFGVELTESSTREEALTAYLEAKGIELEGSAEGTLNLQLRGKLVMTLGSKKQWIDEIPNRLPAKTRIGEQFLFVDANGSKFESGADFEAAEKIGSYPCRIYKLMSVAEFEEGGLNNGN